MDLSVNPEHSLYKPILVSKTDTSKILRACSNKLRGTDVKGLTRGLATLPKVHPGNLVVRDRDHGRSQMDFLAVHCFCV